MGAANDVSGLLHPERLHEVHDQFVSTARWRPVGS